MSITGIVLTGIVIVNCSYIAYHKGKIDGFTEGFKEMKSVVDKTFDGCSMALTETDKLIVDEIVKELKETKDE